MKKTLFALALLATLMFCGCNENNPINTIIDEITHPTDKQETPEEPIIRGTGIVERVFSREDPAPLRLAPSQSQLAYARMGADFAHRLFCVLCDDADPGTNVCISPLSLEIALGMLANGVESEACTELLGVIAGTGVTPDSLNAWYRSLSTALTATHCVRLANALWAQNGYPINPDFISVNQRYYDAEVGNLDFTHTQEAADSICQWAYDHTYGNIRELNLPITPATILVLANATWFGAQWKDPFSDDATQQKPFTRCDGTLQTVYMMNKTISCAYGESATYQMVELPFGVYVKDAEGMVRDVETPFSMLVALPAEGLTPNDILSDIDWGLPQKTCQVGVHLPKFDFKTTNELAEPMQSLGIRKVFAPYGALTGIGDASLSIDFVNQDVSVRIDEKGAEMAAVTTIGIRKNGGIETPAVDFNVNRPFVFAVRDNVSQNILFLGKVESIE